MSKVEVQNPNIIRIAYHQEHSDPNYGSCLWAYYDFDLDEYMLNIQSDCGDASYCWVATPETESFLHLMARIDENYLINKLYRETNVNIDAALAEVKDWLGIGEDEDYQLDLSDDEREEELEELKELFDERGNISPDAAGHILEEWNSDHGFDLDCVWECVVTDFTACEKRVVQIFRDYIQPKIEEILRGEEHGQEEAAPQPGPGGEGTAR